MIAIPDPDYLSPADYLAWESQSEIKHEYIDGQVYAMAGGTKAHNLVSLNLAMGLRSQLKPPCQTFMADMKVMLLSQRRFYYPDLVVTYDDPDDLDSPMVQSPKLIIEVLSESTESFDRGKKFHDYRRLPSLETYLLVSSQDYLVDCFQRTPQQDWLMKTYEGLGATVHIDPLNLALPLKDIYATVELTAPVTDQQTPGT